MSANFTPFGRFSSLRAVGLFDMAELWRSVAAVAAGYSDKVGSLLSFCIELDLDMFAQVGSSTRKKWYKEKRSQCYRTEIISEYPVL